MQDDTNNLESSSAELVDSKLTAGQQCIFVAKAVNSLLDRIENSIAGRLREVILPLYSDLVVPSCSAGSSSQLPSTREMRTYWSQSSKS